MPTEAAYEAAARTYVTTLHLPPTEWTAYATLPWLRAVVDEAVAEGRRQAAEEAYGDVIVEPKILTPTHVRVHVSHRQPTECRWAMSFPAEPANAVALADLLATVREHMTAAHAARLAEGTPRGGS
jgi:hypothetical protein